ncbi:hypothetical protein BRAS3809_7120010 [Bradyrhizobium sp. STM 3809]|nr:hypothetical protein BRAS3809_7120010 [Bradyrhizobium sp. STM 3809]
MLGCCLNLWNAAGTNRVRIGRCAGYDACSRLDIGRVWRDPRYADAVHPAARARPDAEG